MGPENGAEKAPSEPRHARQSLRACERWCWRKCCCCPHKACVMGWKARASDASSDVPIAWILHGFGPLPSATKDATKAKPGPDIAQVRI